MEYQWHNLVGILGVIMVLCAYLWLQLERIEPLGFSYSFLNGLGSGLILVSLLYDFNLPAFLVELAWVFISVIGILRWFKGKGSGLNLSSE